MLITLSDGTAIPGSMLISATLRADLVPVPVSLEMVVQTSPALVKALVRGADLYVGDERIPVTIIKVNTVKTQTVRDDAVLGAVAVVAILSGCLPMISPSRKAIIQADTSIQAAYRSCGAKAAFSADIPLPEFHCLNGQIPTAEVARRLQEESAVIRMSKGKLQAVRLPDLLTGPSLGTFDPSAIQWIDNQSVVDRLTASVVSLDFDGLTLNGDPTESRPLIYRGGLDTRRAKNMERVLITKAVMIRPLDMTMNAGSWLQSGDRKLVVLTAAHRFDPGSMGGSMVMISKLWLAEVSK